MIIPKHLVQRALRVSIWTLIGIHGIVFSGLMLAGLFLLKNGLFRTDYFYGFAWIVVGSVLLFWVIDEGKNMLSSAARVKKERSQILYAVWSVFFATFLLQGYLHTLFVYLGFTIGVQFTHTALAAWSQLLNAQLPAVSTYIWIAWIFQWHYVNLVVRGIAGLLTRKKVKSVDNQSK